MKILQSAQYLQTTYDPLNLDNNFNDTETRQNLLEMIYTEIQLIEGLITVFRAVLKRKIDQSALNTIENRNILPSLDISQINSYLL
jgi:hypothetical protein